MQNATTVTDMSMHWEVITSYSAATVPMTPDPRTNAPPSYDWFAHFQIDNNLGATVSNKGCMADVPLQDALEYFKAPFILLEFSGTGRRAWHQELEALLEFN